MKFTPHCVCRYPALLASCRWGASLNSYIPLPFFQIGLQANLHLQMRFGPNTLGAWAKTRFETRIKKACKQNCI